LPLLEIFDSPVVGLLSMGIVLASLTARIPFPFRIPGALAALLVGGLVHMVGSWTGLLHVDTAHAAFDPRSALWPVEWLAALRFEWLEAWPDTVKYLPIVIPSPSVRSWAASIARKAPRPPATNITQAASSAWRRSPRSWPAPAAA
jgi:hypothetical protein